MTRILALLLVLLAGPALAPSAFAQASAAPTAVVTTENVRSELVSEVVTVKPGFVDTAMTWGLPGLFLVASPEAVAEDILKAVRKKRNVIYTPFFWRFIMLIIIHIPEFIFKKMKI